MMRSMGGVVSQAGHLWGAAATSLAGLLGAGGCGICGAQAPSGLCVGCAATLAPPVGDLHIAGVAHTWALLDYAGARDLVLALKSGDRRLVQAVAVAMASELSSADPFTDVLCPDTVITWAPTSAARARQRGGDQAEVLARALGECTGMRCRRLLRRAPGSPPQHGRSAAARRQGPVFACVATPGSSVVVVDDVMTTGSTMAAAAQVLRIRNPQCVVGAMAMAQSGAS
jgi:predicted amidophosphoribosyltransferase